jgi:hypothetical protein
MPRKKKQNLETEVQEEMLQDVEAPEIESAAPIVEAENKNTIDTDQYDSFFSAEIDYASKVMGRHNVLVGDEAKARKYGIELPSLMLQYINQADVFLMEHLLFVAGKPASHKSSFAFEVARWIIEAGGFARLHDTEGKYSPQLAESLIGTKVNQRTWQLRVCESLDAWTEMVSKDMEAYRKHFKIGEKLKRGEKRPPLLPACMIIDSLTGRTTQDNIKNVNKTGQSSNTQGMRTAKAINDWLQTRNFNYLPWYTIIIRHEKQGGMEGGFSPLAGMTKKTPGGVAPDFMGGLDLRFAVVSNYRGQKAGFNLVKMKTKKNSFGQDNLAGQVRFSWEWRDNEFGETEQFPKWEWNLATAEFVAKYEKADIKDICHVVQGGTVPNPRFNCKQLGLKDVDGETMGAAIMQDEKILKQLQDYLHIVRRTKFSPDMEIPSD